MTSHLAIVTIAVVTALATLRSPALLQAIIVFAGGANACAFLFPAVMAAYMKGATARGVIASMAGGAGTVVLLYLIGVLRNEDPLIGEASKFYPVYLFGVAPFVWGLLVSVVLGIGVSRLDRRRLNTDC
jgi:Na+/proline symporter